MPSDQSTTHPALAHPNDIYPDHYADGNLDCSVEIAFEPALDSDRSCRRQAGGESGHMAITGGRPQLRAVAGTQGTWILRFANNAADMPVGAMVAFLRFNCQFFHLAQRENPKARDYATLETESDAKLELVVGRTSIALARVLVKEGTFRVGDSFTIRIGDRREGSVGSEVFWTATEGEILTAVDANGDGEFVGVRENPFRFEVVAHDRPDLIRVLGPTIVDVGEEFDLHVCVYDRNRNPTETFAGNLEIIAPDGIEGLPPAYIMTAEDKGVRIFEGVSAKSSGVHRVVVRSAQCPGVFFSNPVVAQRSPSRRVYWGDPHCHGWGDSTMYLMTRRTAKLDPKGRHEQATTYGRFDWSAPGAMSMPPGCCDEVWQAWQEACREADQPGKYIPFMSYEAHPPEGDRNVLFRDLEELTPIPMRAPMPEVDKAYAKRDDVLLEVHIGGAPPKWDEYRPERERMVEVVSGFGNAEWLLQKALQLGYRPTVCGASDLHLGLMGGPRAVETFRGRAGYSFPMNQRDAGYGTGPVTAVMARELSRDALWEAMTSGATYATTGARIHLDFRVNDAPPGTEVNVEEGALFALDCHACMPIERVDLIVGTRCLRTWEPYEADFAFDEGLLAEDVPGDWAYVRILQPDAEYAWSNVIYLRGAAGHGDAGDLPLWNAEEPFDLASVEENEAATFLPAVQQYLETEEDASLFQDLTAIGIFTESMGVCALFFCHYGEARRRMQIRWYFRFEIPKVRFDWGWRDFGVVDELVVREELSV